MNAQQTINAFINGRSAKSSNLESDGRKLWSYSTVIAQYINGRIFVNTTKYSSTTIRRQNQLIRTAGAVVTIDGVTIPRGAWDLASYVK